MVTCLNYIPMFDKIFIFYFDFFCFFYLQYMAPSYGNLRQTAILAEGSFYKKKMFMHNYVFFSDRSY